MSGVIVWDRRPGKTGFFRAVEGHHTPLNLAEEVRVELRVSSCVRVTPCVVGVVDEQVDNLTMEEFIRLQGAIVIVGEDERGKGHKGFQISERVDVWHRHERRMSSGTRKNAPLPLPSHPTEASESLKPRSVKYFTANATKMEIFETGVVGELVGLSPTEISETRKSLQDERAETAERICPGHPPR
jgi:hypothetical protein